ncbi:MAG TPA: polysaccharide deacetylase family protein, partial [Azospirillaceae bacterium]|nr:polysaccharide deacetylase family protein [Azospirillaceae bacterium]
VFKYSVRPNTLAARTLDGFIRYSTDDAKVLAEIERRTRRRGRIGAVLPGGGLEVTPAILTQPEFNICALTFDDGPHRTVTRRILEILNEQKVVSTYFPVGNVAIRYPDVIRDFVASGHEIGNHSYTHGDMRQMKIETLRHEVAETNRILRELGGSSTLFRPPYGRYSQDLLQVVREEGGQAVLWNVDTRDWKVRDPDKIVEHVTTAAGSGSVLLLHSTYPTTAEALPRVIATLREKNCEFVTLSDWIARMQAAGELPVTNAALPGPAPTTRLRN